ncbi:phosphoribosyltransferase [Rhodopirellula bahusiensis]|uniref:Phosphoribosyltransferase domain-containing protein n=1 Tax=Rhodopirellula bahusiensis TaxID=2014065 RepID=A0A2G1VXM9_9BACT|nr:hypothetical protein CEE69_31470 [Rhodopirellula bahusiensis]
MIQELSIINSTPKIRRPLKQGRFGNPLLSRKQVERCVELLAESISNYYCSMANGGDDVVFLTVMHGGKTFSSDLAPLCASQPAPSLKDPGYRSWYASYRVVDRYIDIKSYDGQIRGEPVVMASDLTRENLAGKRVLLIDDICETGNTIVETIQFIRKLCRYSQQDIDRLVRTVTFLWKPECPSQSLRPDWYGYRTSMHFLSGYGMDSKDGSCRQLPAIFIDDNRQSMVKKPSWAFRFDQSETGSPINRSQKPR